MEKELTKEKYQHVEAFHLMLYQCEKYHPEMLWNSRDGVTPFCIACRYCGENSNHVNWRGDELAENFSPPVGMRIFRNGNDDEAAAIIRTRLARHPDFLNGMDPESVIKKMVSDGHEFQPGWPMIAIVEPERATA